MGPGYSEGKTPAAQCNHCSEIPVLDSPTPRQTSPPMKPSIYFKNKMSPEGRDRWDNAAVGARTLRLGSAQASTNPPDPGADPHCSLQVQEHIQSSAATHDPKTGNRMGHCSSLGSNSKMSLAPSPYKQLLVPQGITAQPRPQTLPALMGQRPCPCESCLASVDMQVITSGILVLCLDIYKYSAVVFAQIRILRHGRYKAAEPQTFWK